MGFVQAKIRAGELATPEAVVAAALSAWQGLAERFAEAVKAAIQLLADYPQLGKRTAYRHPKLAGIRLFIVRKPFQVHLVFYRVHHEEPELIRVIHGRRDLPHRLIVAPGAD